MFYILFKSNNYLITGYKKIKPLEYFKNFNLSVADSKKEHGGGSWAVGKIAFTTCSDINTLTDIKLDVKGFYFINNLNNDNLLTANSIILGEELAFSLGVLPGDEIKVTSSSMISTPLGQIPRSHN